MSRRGCASTSSKVTHCPFLCGGANRRSLVFHTHAMSDSAHWLLIWKRRNTKGWWLHSFDVIISFGSHGKMSSGTSASIAKMYSCNGAIVAMITSVATHDAMSMFPLLSAGQSLLRL